MTKAVFWIDNGDYIGFDISGHTGKAEAGKDIVCAAISAMAMLTVNTVREIFSQEASVKTDEKKAAVSFRLNNRDKYSSGLIKGFYEELTSLEKDYPANLRVITEVYQK